MFFFVVFACRAAQKLAAQSTSAKSSRTSNDMANTSARNGGFCGALQRAPPPMPPGLARRLANKENYGIGKVSAANLKPHNIYEAFE